MSSFKKLLAGAFALALTTAAHAVPSATATIVRITGSTAYRGATQTAIKNILLPGSPTLVYGYVGGSLTAANQAIFYGHIGSAEYIIETAFTGSAGGIQLVGQGKTTAFIDVAVADGTTLTTGGAAITPATVAYVPDITMSDTYQNASPFTPNAVAPFTTPTLLDTKVGIVPFKWVTSRGSNVLTLTATTTAGSAVVSVPSTSGLTVGMTVSGANLPSPTAASPLVAAPLASIISVDSVNSQVTLNVSANVLTGTASAAFATPSPITNITPQLAQAVFVNGSAELALFTGNSANIGSKVFAIGRDADSGTRLTAFAETGVGVAQHVKQYTPVTSGGAVTSQALSAAVAVNLIPYGVGEGGYAGGGSLAAAVGNTTAAINGHYVTYLSTGDAGTAIGLGAKEIAYNGVTYSLTNLQQGLYSFWSYEHLMYKDTLDSTKVAIATAVANQILNTDATVLISTMKVGRSSDGGVVTQNY